MQNCVGKSSADGGTFIFEFWRFFEFDFPSRSHHTSEIHFLCFFALFRLLAVCLSEICLLAYMLVSPNLHILWVFLKHMTFLKSLCIIDDGHFVDEKHNFSEAKIRII